MTMRPADPNGSLFWVSNTSTHFTLSSPRLYNPCYNA
jgi:hypothetical protein